MSQAMKSKPFTRMCGRLVLAAALLGGPAMVRPALARDEEPEREIVDARLEGYKENVTLPPSSSGLTWVLLVVCGTIALMGLFKDAKRTHLD
jgi:hypothetical protein